MPAPRPTKRLQGDVVVQIDVLFSETRVTQHTRKRHTSPSNAIVLADVHVVAIGYALHRLKHAAFAKMDNTNANPPETCARDYQPSKSQALLLRVPWVSKARQAVMRLARGMCVPKGFPRGSLASVGVFLLLNFGDGVA